MQSPFWDNLRRLKGRSLIMAAAIWGLVLVLAVFCVAGGLPLGSGGKTATATPTLQAMSEVQPTATLPSVIILPTPTSAPSTPGETTETVQPTEVVTPSLPPLPWGDFGYGVALQGVIPVMGDYYYSMRQATDHLGFNWVKQQLRWSDVYTQAGGEGDWRSYDPVVEVANKSGLKLLLSVVDAPAWTHAYVDADPLAAPPDDLALYANFLGELVDRYPGQIGAIEVWNEENLNREWDTAEGLDPERYVEMLRLAYQAIKSRDPNIVVISGALSPTGVTATDPDNPNRYLYMDDYVYLQRMIDAGFLDYTDCVGVHHNGINMPPDVSWDEGYDDPTATFRGPFVNPHHSWSFKSTLWDYRAMIQRAGYDKPLCVTEFGWASAEGWTQVPAGFEFAWDNTLEEQAQWDVEAFQLMRQWGFVHLAFLWNLDYSQKGGIGETDPNAPYSLIDFTGAGRPAFFALGEMPKIP